MSGPGIKRYYLIDASRGIAAICVMALHYKGFMIDASWGTYPSAGGYKAPLEDLLWPAYRHGELAVPFFWMISGFIFCFVYRGSKISFRNFAVKRFARLYPLHLATLLIVLAFQAVLYLQISETPFFPNNDPYHFVLNLFFISAWGFETGLSFNGPIWSVSVELIVYALFWLYVRTLPVGILTAVLLAAISFALTKAPFLGLPAYCAVLFFLGVFTYLTLTKLGVRRALYVGAGGIALFAAVALGPGTDGIPKTLVLFLAFAPVLMILGALDMRNPREHKTWLLRQLAVLGDISYAVYLLHFPIILILVNLIVLAGVDRAFLSDSLLFFVLFVSLVIFVSYQSTRYFEQPMRRYLQRKLSHA